MLPLGGNFQGEENVRSCESQDANPEPNPQVRDPAVQPQYAKHCGDQKEAENCCCHTGNMLIILLLFLLYVPDKT